MFADLVLEGGGVKGIGLVGAISALEERGYEFKRVAGTSAGSIVGSLVAAGMSASDIEAVMKKLDYNKFQDGDLLDRVGHLGKGISLLLKQGIFLGNYARSWVSDQLRGAGVHTFGDLAYNDTEHPLPPERAYRLVVMTSDVSQGALRRLPWDYGRYDCVTDQQPVADAVRASMSIPFFYRPVSMTDHVSHKRCLLVDGGMLSNFPIDVFDAPADREPRWPTFGIKLSARAGSMQGVINDVHDTVSLTRAMIGTMTGFYDRLHIDDPSVQDRTIFVDTGHVKATQFDLDEKTQQMLFDNGRAAAERFFDGTKGHPGWDWDAFKRKYRSADAH